MKSGRFSERIVVILKRRKARQKVVDLARKVGVSEATIYAWKGKYSGLDVSEAQRLGQLEQENRQLNH